MVSYYNPATVAMFSRTGSAHYHHHHSPPSQNPYFGPAAAAYGGYHHPHAHPHSHQQGSGGSPVGVGSGIGVGSGLTGVSSTQFSPSMSTDFNCNHPQYHPHQFSNMTPDTMAGASWHQSSMYTSACAAARNAAALGVAPHPSSYEDWTAGAHPAVSAGHHGHVHPHHPSFYHHAQPSPPSSTPSPNSSHPGGNHSPHNHVYSTSSTTPNNNNNNNSSPFKTEFGPCSGGNPQENTSQEMNGQVVVSSGGPSIGNPHSPDSGMAISDGVSSSGSPATGQQYQNNCLGGPSSSGNGSNAPTTGPNDNNNNNNLLGSQNPMLHHGSHNLHHSHHHLSLSQGANNLNQMSAVSHQSPLLNNSNTRPTQARSPYEWMKKPSYSVGSSSSNNAKTRTKDKYRVVYSDTQRLELEKEFHYSRYITIRRKAELASNLGLSERQVKIWFQNRRAKERKIVRKKEEMMNRDKISNISMAHMQHAAVAAAGGMGGMPGNLMCNQSNGGLPLLM